MDKRAYLRQIDDVIARGRYKASWQSLWGHAAPSWYVRDKFGIFIHWGVYSVPAFGNEWYARNMYDADTPEFAHHRRTYGDQKTFGYKDFIPLFRAENFDPAAWISLFRDAGARFVMPVCEHHDGFAMYATAFNRWNATAMGPCRDVIGELRAQCERQGLTFCASTHRAEHYFFMNMGRTFDSDVNDPRYDDFYGPAVYCPEYAGERLHATTADTYAAPPSRAWLEDWMVRTCELIDNYQPSILYFDWWIHNYAFKPYLQKICAYYYNRADEWGREVTINYKHEAFPPSIATFDVERGALTGMSPVPWQTDTAIGRESWGYRRDNTYKSARQIVCDLVNIVSKNGILLLNVGPRADGTITDEETDVLRGIGRWLRVNGEGIYGTTIWTQYGEGDANNADGFFRDGEETAFTDADFRFTYKDGFLYAFQMRPSASARIRTLRLRETHDRLIESVELLGSEAGVEYERTREALEIRLRGPVRDDLPQCFRIGIL